MQVADAAWILRLPWLWCRPAATALISPLTWEPPYAEGVVLKGQGKKKKKKGKEKKALFDFTQ